MSPQEIIKEVVKLPLEQQKEVLETLSANLQKAELTEEEKEQEVLRRLLAKGIISRIPPRWNDEDDDDFEPVEIAGEPISETIIRERR